MLKQIGGWWRHMSRYTHFRVNDSNYRLTIVFNEAGGPVNFAFLVFGDRMLSKARCTNPSRWLFCCYWFGRRIVLPTRKPIPLSE